jgi:hypothetical protein
MKNPATMAQTEKDTYIFAKGQSQAYDDGRFAWISECLLGDTRTFLDGIDNYIQNKATLQDRGGGNLSVPILICTALELASALYAGKTQYMKCTECQRSIDYNATDNVKKFVDHFFPGISKRLPFLLWDGIRNGIVHTFSPKPFTYRGKNIRFQFCVEPKTKQSYATEVNGTVLIRINAFELYEILGKAIENYQKELKTDSTLKDNFIRAWSSIEEDSSRNIDKSKEPKTSLAELEKANNHLLLFGN